MWMDWKAGYVNYTSEHRLLVKRETEEERTGGRTLVVDADEVLAGWDDLTGPPLKILNQVRTSVACSGTVWPTPEARTP